MDAPKHEVLLCSPASPTCHSKDILLSVLTLQVPASESLSNSACAFLQHAEVPVTSLDSLFSLSQPLLLHLLKSDLHKENTVMTLRQKKKSQIWNQPPLSYLSTLSLGTLIPCQSPPAYRSPVHCVLAALWVLTYTYRFVPTRLSPTLAAYTHHLSAPHTG